MIVIEDIPSDEERAYNLYPNKYFPIVGALDAIVDCVPKQSKKEERKRWKDKMLQVVEKHRYLHNQPQINIETDVVYCGPYYCEMVHDYDLQ